MGPDLQSVRTVFPLNSLDQVLVPHWSLWDFCQSGFYAIDSQCQLRPSEDAHMAQQWAPYPSRQKCIQVWSRGGDPNLARHHGAWVGEIAEEKSSSWTLTLLLHHCSSGNAPSELILFSKLLLRILDRQSRSLPGFPCNGLARMLHIFLEWTRKTQHKMYVLLHYSSFTNLSINWCEWSHIIFIFLEWREEDRDTEAALCQLELRAHICCCQTWLPSHRHLPLLDTGMQKGKNDVLCPEWIPSLKERASSSLCWHSQSSFKQPSWAMNSPVTQTIQSSALPACLNIYLDLRILSALGLCSQSQFQPGHMRTNCSQAFSVEVFSQHLVLLGKMKRSWAYITSCCSGSVSHTHNYTSRLAFLTSPAVFKGESSVALRGELNVSR